MILSNLILDLTVNATKYPSPDGSDILLCWRSAQKIQRTAGLASSAFNRGVKISRATKHYFTFGIKRRLK
jgi:hypothetical protein